MDKEDNLWDGGRLISKYIKICKVWKENISCCYPVSDTLCQELDLDSESFCSAMITKKLVGNGCVKQSTT